ncbi:MAG: TrkA C-terminal domain-containing protein [Planctomycetota bacterium]
MLPLFAVLVVLSVSLLIIRVGTVAFMMTGLAPQVARFQARSAYFGVGFTTAEAEKVLNNPVRREIVMMLMLLGNAGIISVISTVVLSTTEVPEDGAFSHVWFRIAFLALGICTLFMLAYSKWIDRRISKAVRWALHKWTRLETQDYSEMLHLARDYSVSEFPVQEGDWMAGRPLRELRLRDEGVMILGIERADGTYIGVPRGHCPLEVGDRLIAYGKHAMLQALEKRRAGYEGDRQHQAAVEWKQSVGEALDSIPE